MKYIWIGASGLAEQLYHKWVGLFNSYKPNVILDNDLKKHGNTFLGVKVDAVESITSHITQDSMVIITTSYQDQIREQLKKLGIIERVFDFNEVNYQLNHLVLGRNSSLLNKRNKDRCFIVGNGPSFKEVNYTLLKGEDIFVVNHAYKSEILMQLEPRFWVIADPLFWKNIDLGYKAILEIVNGSNTNTSLIVNRNALYFLPHEYSLDENTYFYDMSLLSNEDKLDSVNFSYPLKNYAQNVLSPAIMLAIYLRYKEVYLIGFDHSWWGYSEDDVKAGRPIPHLYSNTKEDEKIVQDCFQNLGYQGLRKTIDRQVIEYAKIREYAEEIGVLVATATEAGYLNTFERISFESIFNYSE